MIQIPRYRASEKSLPDSVYLQLVQLLYKAIFPVTLVGMLLVCIGTVIGVREHDPVVDALVAFGGLVSLVRVLLVLHFRKMLTNETCREKAARLQRFYGYGSYVFAATVGLLGLRVFAAGDVTSHMLFTGLIFGYAAGVVARLSIRPVICITTLSLASAPAVMACLLDFNFFYIVHGLLLTAFWLGSLETVDYNYHLVVDQIAIKEEMADLARLDPLTELPNRFSARERLSSELGGMRRGGAMLALHYLDFDHFKPVNDRFGHPVGDLVLRAAAQRISGLLRDGDMVARLGGDEFMVLQFNVGHQDQAEMLARRIIQAIAAPFGVEGHEISIGASVGIALAPKDGGELKILLEHADTALYVAKRSGRGKFAFYEPAKFRIEGSPARSLSR
ncbi:diguanylate cyclase [Faunimonas pinastri]|uniref:Diguanylate cyclase n=1 Tax=Faunimonas pinastri TaxID=1855383 RepID=A0A1H9M1Y6_9HYPH|nr:GGDEF domain-containing protein [Faunimonas pinastri]SER17700.1 diguanylate cyclase [Faunimonas pinastri]